MAKLVDLDVRSVSVVDRPANKKEMILRSEKPDADGWYDVSVPLRIVKTDAAKGIIYNIVYESEAIDSQEDWTDESTIEAAAHKWMEQGRQREIDIQHDGRTGKGVMVESFMLRGSHPNYPSVDNPAWASAIKLGDEAMLRVASGELMGVSLEGRAKLDFSAEPPASKKAQRKKTLIKAHKHSTIKIIR